MKKMIIGLLVLLPVIGMAQQHLYGFPDTPTTRAIYAETFNTGNNTSAPTTQSSWTPLITQKQYDSPVVLQTPSGDIRVLNLDDNPIYPYFTPLTQEESYLKDNYIQDKLQRQRKERLLEMRAEQRQRDIIREEIYRAKFDR